MASAKAERPIGIRQHNPGHLEITRDKWLGALKPEPGDRFVRFQAPQFGIRAMGRTLLTYDKRGINTVRAIITRWAPAHENDVAAYIDDVAGRMAVDPDDYLDVDDYATAKALVDAIIAHENANYRYKDQIVADGLRLAGIHDAPKKALVKKGAFMNQAAAGLGGAAIAAGGAVEPVKKVVDGLDPFSAAPPVQWLITGGLTLCAGLALAGALGVWLQHRKGL